MSPADTLFAGISTAGEDPNLRHFAWDMSPECLEERILKAEITAGRLGNNYISAKNAIIFSLFYKFKKLLLLKRDGTFFLEGPFVKESEFLAHEKCLATSMYSTLFLYMDPDFYCRENPELYAEAMSIIRESFILKVDPVPIPANILVIHVRSGDLFSPSPHPNYVQPPFCWHQACIMTHRALYPKMAVLVVAEDRLNPCVDAIISFCGKLKIPCQLQSASLEEDFAHVMGASSLVSSFGSFIAPVIDLNANLAHLYRYRRRYVKPGRYIPQSQWKNTEEQRRLMLELPLDALALPEDFGQDSYFARETAEPYKH